MKKNTLLQNQNIGCNLDLSELQDELLGVFKSPNPLSIYGNIQEIRYKFSSFMSCLGDKIQQGFILEPIDGSQESMVMSLYRQSNYQKIWIENSQNYIRNARYFDILSYFYFAKTINKSSHIIFLGLLYLYEGKQEQEIYDLLKNFSQEIEFEKIKNIYDYFEIEKMNFSINLREDFIEHFIEKIYLSLDNIKKEQFIDNFIIKIHPQYNDFSGSMSIFNKILQGYTCQKDFEDICDIIEKQVFQTHKKEIDFLLETYSSNKNNFYSECSDILQDLQSYHRAIFWKYIKRKIIDIYYPEVKNMFYNLSSNNFLNKDTYSKLSSQYVIGENISPEAQYMEKEFEEIMVLKEIILELHKNIFSSFLLPIVYYTIAEEIDLKKKDLIKMKYILLFIFSKNYNEYKKIYMFFNQLEIFLNYENKNNAFVKIQISFSLILILSFILFFSFSFFPFGIFLAILLFAIMKYVEIIHPNMFFSMRWNIGVRFFATLFLIVSGYFWLTNLDKVQNDSKEVLQIIENLGTISSSEVIQHTSEFVNTTLERLK